MKCKIFCKLGEFGASCYTGLIIRKLITQSIYVKKFFFFTVDCWRIYLWRKMAKSIAYYNNF